jgi:hypothetical protein
VTAPSESTSARDLGVLAEMLDSEGIVAWLRNRNPALDFRRPLDTLSQGGDWFQEVLGVARDIPAGTYL